MRLSVFQMIFCSLSGRREKGVEVDAARLKSELRGSHSLTRGWVTLLSADQAHHLTSWHPGHLRVQRQKSGSQCAEQGTHINAVIQNTGDAGTEVGG